MILTESKLFELTSMAEEMLTDIGLSIPDYRYAINETKSIFGRCSYTKRTITISKYLAKFYDEDKVLNTCVHELLHAIAWESYKCSGHTGKWKELANKVNCVYDMDIKRCGEVSEGLRKERELRAKYIVQCTSCGAKFARQRRSEFIKEVERNNGKNYTCGCGSSHFELV